VRLVPHGAGRAATGETGAQDALLPKVRLAADGDREAERVEDVLQEAVEGLLLALPSFKGQCTVLHFACRVAVLSALASRRRATFRAEFVVDAPEAGEQAPSPTVSPLESVSANRRRQVVGQLLDDLPPVQAEVLVLHCALGFTVDEIALSVGRPKETVRSRLRLAKQALRERISASAELAEILEVAP